MEYKPQWNEKTRRYEYIVHIHVDQQSPIADIEYATADLCQYLNDIDINKLGLSTVDDYKAQIDELMRLRGLLYNAKRIQVRGDR
jgi:hypothetical protein